MNAKYNAEAEYDQLVADVAITKETTTAATVSGKIRELTATGMTRSAIAKQLGIRYQHVRNVQLQVLKKTAAK